MQQALALNSAPVIDPILEAARELKEMLASGRPIRRETLRELFEASTGRSDADGHWTMRNAYDALELGQVLFLTGTDCPIDERKPAAALAHLEQLVQFLPTQSYRAEEQIALQAFSTPLPLAWLAGRAATLALDDTVLEPSAGTGLLAAVAKRTGCRLILNEIDPVRRRCLAAAYPEALLSSHDAELINDLLGPAAIPDVILMNPPFARSTGRGEDRYAAARHFAAALARLAPNGRLVAIMPESFSESGSGSTIRATVDAQATLRLDALLSPGAFGKHGTRVTVRLIVYDKLRDDGGPVRVQTNSLAELLNHVDGLGERPSPPVQPPALNPKISSMFGRSVARPRVSPPAPPRSTKSGKTEPLIFQILTEPAPTADQVGIYLPYRPSRVAIADAATHPTPLVESIAMGSIAAPRPRHVPVLPADLVACARLSEAQLETLIYAGSAFERDLPGRFVATKEGCDLEAADQSGSAYRTGPDVPSIAAKPLVEDHPRDLPSFARASAVAQKIALGREVPAAQLSELGNKLGLDMKVDLSPGELADTVLQSGKSQPFRGVEDLILKRSLVNGNQRLELTGFEASRLPWYKAQGCFTEIIRYQTRLFVPSDRAAGVLGRLAARIKPASRKSRS